MNPLIIVDQVRVYQPDTEAVNSRGISKRPATAEISDALKSLQKCSLTEVDAKAEAARAPWPNSAIYVGAANAVHLDTHLSIDVKSKQLISQFSVSLWESLSSHLNNLHLIKIAANALKISLTRWKNILTHLTPQDKLNTQALNEIYRLNQRFDEIIDYITDSESEFQDTKYDIPSYITYSESEFQGTKASNSTLTIYNDQLYIYT